MATQPVPPGLHVTRYQGDLSNPDVATAQTVEVMCEQIQKAAQDPLVKKAARDAVNRFRGGPLYASAGINPWRNQHAQAESVWWWCKHVLKFAHHDGMIAVYFNEFDQLQLLIAPDLLLRMSDPRGDCAIYTMLECAMLQALGIDSEIVTSAVDPFAPDVFSHVYPRAVMSSGRRLVLDASHGKYPGWEVPPEHTLRKQVWDLQGKQIPDQAPRFKGLHGYAYRGRGLGAVCPTPSDPQYPQGCPSGFTLKKVFYTPNSTQPFTYGSGNTPLPGLIPGQESCGQYQCSGGSAGQQSPIGVAQAGCGTDWVPLAIMGAGVAGLFYLQGAMKLLGLAAIAAGFFEGLGSHLQATPVPGSPGQFTCVRAVTSW